MRSKAGVLHLALFVGLTLGCAAATARAGDHFLTIGGGSSPSNNPVSLEKNVLYLQRFLADRGMGGVPHEVLFSDGNAGARDLQYVDPDASIPRVNRLLAEVFGQDKSLDDQYRAHAIPHVWGASDRQTIERWFDTIGSALHAGDRLIIYYTGHGSGGSPPRNTTFTLWGERDMTVREFASLLDRLPRTVSVVLIMVQCHSGGFADVLFDGADASHGLSASKRCGFFAAPFDRIAAGCTSDVDEENYREFSTYFWAALYGRKRTGEPVPPPDYDGNGRVSLAEAHAYTLINSDTIDIPEKTTDAFLRRFSRMKAGGLTADVDFAQLSRIAEAPERAALDGLSQRLNLRGPNRTDAARRMADALQQRRNALDRERQRLDKDHNRACASLAALVKRQWPELANPFNPAAQRVILTEGDKVVRAIESAPRYADLRKQDERLDQIEAESSDLERQWAKCQRFVRVAEHVALAANLAATAPADIQARYWALAAEEAGTLGDMAGPATP